MDIFIFLKYFRLSPLLFFLPTRQWKRKNVSKKNHLPHITLW